MNSEIGVEVFEVISKALEKLIEKANEEQMCKTDFIFNMSSLLTNASIAPFVYLKLLVEKNATTSLSREDIQKMSSIIKRQVDEELDSFTSLKVSEEYIRKQIDDREGLTEEAKIEILKTFGFVRPEDYGVESNEC